MNTRTRDDNADRVSQMSVGILSAPDLMKRQQWEAEKLLRGGLNLRLEPASEFASSAPVSRKENLEESPHFAYWVWMGGKDGRWGDKLALQQLNQPY